LVVGLLIEHPMIFVSGAAIGCLVRKAEKPRWRQPPKDKAGTSLGSCWLMLERLSSAFASALANRTLRQVLGTLSFLGILAIGFTNYPKTISDMALSHQTLVTPLIDTFLYGSAAGGLACTLLAHPALTSLGTVALEVYVLSPGMQNLFSQQWNQTNIVAPWAPVVVQPLGEAYNGDTDAHNFCPLKPYGDGDDDGYKHVPDIFLFIVTVYVVSLIFAHRVAGPACELLKAPPTSGSDKVKDVFEDKATGATVQES
jgi:hypothetical protein